MINTIRKIEAFERQTASPRSAQREAAPGNSQAGKLAFYIATNQANQQFITSKIHPSSNKTFWQAITSHQYESIKEEFSSKTVPLNKRPSSYYVHMNDGREVGLPAKSNHPAYEAAREAQYYLQDRVRHSGSTKETMLLIKFIQKGLEKPVAGIPVAGIHRGRGPVDIPVAGNPVNVNATEIKNTLDASFVQALRQSSRVMQQDYLEAMHREKQANREYVDRSPSLSETGRKTHLSYHERNEFKMKDGHAASYNIDRIERISSVVSGKNQDQFPLQTTSRTEVVLDQAYRRMWQERQYVASSTLQQLRKELQQDLTLKNDSPDQDTTKYQERKAQIETLDYRALQPNELVEHYYTHRKQGKPHDKALTEVANHVTKHISITSGHNHYREIVQGKQDHHLLSQRNYREVSSQFQSIENIHQSVDHASGIQRLISSKDKRLDHAFSVTNTLGTTPESIDLATRQHHAGRHSPTQRPDAYLKLVDKISQDQQLVKQQRLVELNTKWVFQSKDQGIGRLSSESNAPQKGGLETSSHHNDLKKSYPNLSEEKIARYASMLEKNANQPITSSNQVEVDL